MAPIRIALTAGEPAGIGPDLVASLAGQPPAGVQLVAVGSRQLLRQRAGLLGRDLAGLDIVDIPLPQPAHPGRLNPANARHVLDALREAALGCRQGRYDAMVTAPVQKSVINQAGTAFSGHTEFLRQLTGAPRAVMMLASERMRVALATTHLPLREVADAIRPGLLRSVLQVLWGDLRRHFGIASPRIAVLGLNPHAGESGHLGREELEVIAPALESLRERGMRLLGPLPADTAFQARALERCDAVLAMYHDQGLPVLKYAGFGKAVNITLGLPILRTSVDHGTALELAGTGKADSGSLRHAIEVAADMARSRRP